MGVEFHNICGECQVKWHNMEDNLGQTNQSWGFDKLRVKLHILTNMLRTETCHVMLPTTRIVQLFSEYLPVKYEVAVLKIHVRNQLKRHVKGYEFKKES